MIEMVPVQPPVEHGVTVKGELLFDNSVQAVHDIFKGPNGGMLEPSRLQDCIWKIYVVGKPRCLTISYSDECGN